jgi:glycosyltransferase involved in cell wall biosynthesis
MSAPVSEPDKSPLNTANRLLRDGDTAAAISLLEELTATQPGFYPYHQNLAHAHAMAGDIRGAKDCTADMVMVAPQTKLLEALILAKARRVSAGSRPRPTLSIVVPIHNTAKYLAQCIESILSQDLRDFELILVDDGSTDESPTIIRKYAQADDRIVVLVNLQPSGNQGTPRNQALRVARGKYVGFVDSDDWIEPGYFATLCARAHETSADIVFSAGFRNHESGGYSIRRYPPEPFSDASSRFHRYHESFTIWDKVFRRELLDSFDIRLGETRAAVDVPFIFKAYYHAKNTAHCPDLIGYNYRRETPTSVTVRLRKKSYCDFEFQAYEDIGRWAHGNGVDGRYLDIIAIRKVSSFLYNLGLIQEGEFEGVYGKVQEAFSRIDRSVVEQFATAARKPAVLQGFDDVLTLPAARYFAKHRKGSVEVSNGPSVTPKFRVDGPKAGIVFFPAWMQANPYLELFYTALNRRYGVRVAGYASDDFSLDLLKTLRPQFAYVHLHWLHAFIGSPGFDVAAFTRTLEVARKLGYKIVYTAHNVISHDAADPAAELAIRQAIAQHVDLAIAHGVQARRRLVKEIGVPAARIAVMPHGSYRGCYGAGSGRSQARRELGLRPDEFVFLFLGNIRGYKGLMPLLDSFAKVRHAQPLARLVIAGRVLDPAIGAWIRQRIDNDPSVVFRPGFVPSHHVGSYFNACEAVVLPYERILTSGAAVLSLSFGRPVIAPRAGVLPEFVHEGIGDLFDSFDDMTRLMSSWVALWHAGGWRERFSPEHFTRFNKDHDWDKVVQGLPLCEADNPSRDLASKCSSEPASPATAGAPARIFVLDPGLRDTLTHHHVINSMLCRRAVLEGVPFTVFASGAAATGTFPYSVHPIFRNSVYQDSPALDDERYGAQVQGHYHDLQVVFDTGGECALIVHSATAAFLKALGLVLQARRPSVRALAVELMFHPLSLASPGKATREAQARYLLALRLLTAWRDQQGGRLTLATSCAEFAEFYSAMLGERVPIHPYALLSETAAVRARALHAKPRTERDRRRVLLFAGDLKMDKGLGWITEALPRLLAACPDADFVMQLGENRFGKPEITAAVARLKTLASTHLNVELIDGFLPDFAWSALLSSIDVAVFAYSPRAYSRKTSGIFWEIRLATADRAFLVVTRGTWLAREAARRGLSLKTVKYGDSQALADCLAPAVSPRTDATEGHHAAGPRILDECFATGNDTYLFEAIWR